MKSLLISLLLLSVGNCALRTTFTSDTKAISFNQNNSHNPDSLAERIRRVENGLLPPVIFNGQ